MTIDRRSIGRIVSELKSAGTDTQNVEVKESVQKLPAALAETLSAFANASGGTIILGMSEADGFVPAPGFRAKAMADALASMCTDKLTPPVRAEINIVEYDGAQLVVANIPEFVLHDKPCYITERGVYHGSYTRVSDGDHKLSSYEVDRLLENRLQPTFDIDPIEKASLADLDQELVKAVLARQRQIHARIFSPLSDEEALVSLHVLVRDEGGRLVPTLAGLLALGTYPQSFFPRLTVAFAAFGESEDGQAPECLDAQTMAGPMPAVLEDTLAAIVRNVRAYGDKATESDTAPNIPLAAAREAVANALMHRDYSPASRGTAVQVNLHPDRLEVTSPGGLYGPLAVEDLGRPVYSSTRNQFLAALLESVPFQDGYLVETRGSGYQLMEQELSRAGLPQPEVQNSISVFSLTLHKSAAAMQAVSPRTGDALLEVLGRVPDASAAELAEETGMPRSTISYRLRKLIAQGLVERIGEPRSPKQRYRLA